MAAVVAVVAVEVLVVGYVLVLVVEEYEGEI